MSLLRHLYCRQEVSRNKRSVVEPKSADLLQLLSSRHGNSLCTCSCLSSLHSFCDQRVSPTLVPLSLSLASYTLQLPLDVGLLPRKERRLREDRSRVVQLLR